MKKLCMLLGIAFGPALIAACFALLAPERGSAYNEYNNEYRKWPWRAGTEEYITTLPGDHPWPIEEAIDFGLVFEGVHSIVPKGEVYDYGQYADNCGGRMTITDLDDGTYITFCHLDTAYVSEGETVYQGKRIANSGDTGIGPAHLHIQRDLLPYQGTSITLLPIAGYTAKNQLATYVNYPSDNAGIGYDSGGSLYPAFTAAYDRYGGYDAVGVTWDPCGGGACWWAHVWAFGLTQDFIGPNRYQGDGGHGALMQEYGYSTAYHISGGIWEAYKTIQWKGYPALGYPINDEYSWSGGLWQGFRCGLIGYDPGDGDVYYSYEGINTDAEPIDNGPVVSGDDITVPYGDILRDPCDPDRDNDWLSDAEETTRGTNRYIQDTDGDTWIDGIEVLRGTNPLASSSKPGCSISQNPDWDCLNPDMEALFGSNASVKDTDGDGIHDGMEVNWWGTSPVERDSDGDGCDDDKEIAEINGDAVANSLDEARVALRVWGAQDDDPYDGNPVPDPDMQVSPAFDINRDGVMNALDPALVALNSSMVEPAEECDCR